MQCHSDVEVGVGVGGGVGVGWTGLDCCAGRKGRAGEATQGEARSTFRSVV